MEDREDGYMKITNNNNNNNNKIQNLIDNMVKEPCKMSSKQSKACLD